VSKKLGNPQVCGRLSIAANIAKLPELLRKESAH